MKWIAQAGQAAKLLVAGAGAVTVSLESAYPGHLTWLPSVTAAVTAALVYLVPNQPAPPAPKA